MAVERVRRVALERGHVITFYETEDFQGIVSSHSGQADLDGQELLARAKSMVIEYVDVTNVVVGKEATASAEENRAGRAIDGNAASSWSPRSGAPYWLAVDLGQPHTLYRWAVKLEGSSTLFGGPTDGPLNRLTLSCR